MKASADTMKLADELPARVPPYGICILLFVIVTSCTDAFFQADTFGYAESVKIRDFVSDFGHLFWYPFSFAVTQVWQPLSRQFVGDSELVNIVWTMVALNWLAGLAILLLVHSLLRRFCQQAWAIWTATITLLFTLSFLNFSQAGTPYVPALACLTAGLWCLVVRWERSVWWGALAGCCLGLSTAFWVPFLWGYPGVLLAPVILGLGSGRFLDTLLHRKLIALTIAGTLTVAAIFVPSALVQGIDTPLEFRNWVLLASHQADDRGLLRAALGFARSFLDLGRDGLLFKRFLVHDPYNPVTIQTLLAASLWKICAFYLGLALLFWQLWRQRQPQRFVLFWLVSIVPVLFFGVLWEGGAHERYLALMPTTMLAFGYALDRYERPRLAQLVGGGFCLLFVVLNGAAMWKPRIQAQETRLAGQIAPMLAELPPTSKIFLLNKQDPLWRFNWDFPFHPLSQEKKLPIEHLVEPGTVSILRWKEDFAQLALTAWQQHGAIFVTQQVLATAPQPDWYWAEGSDERISWKQIHDFFTSFEMETFGSGFVRLTDAPANRQRLQQLLDATPLTLVPSSSGIYLSNQLTCAPIPPIRAALRSGLQPHKLNHM